MQQDQHAKSLKSNNSYGVEIICIGTELLLGSIVNTNSQWIAEQLAQLGLPHYHQTVVGDNPERLKEAVIKASKRSHILITTGGLGPTPDDITTAILAETFNTLLEEREGIWIDIKEKLANRNHPIAKNNRKQALIPQGADLIPNPSGTAPGIIWSPKQGFTLLTFPGVPSELKDMWMKSAVPWLKKYGGIKNKIISKTLRFTGISESKLSEQVNDLLKRPNPSVAPYASMGDVKLRITAQGNSFAQATALIIPIEEEIKRRTGVLCYGSDNESLAYILIKKLRENQETLSVAESCTGGGLGTTITSISGSSEVFLGGVISYNNTIKKHLLNVSQDLLDKHGAVSKEVAQAMANGVRKIMHSDWAIAISGIAGPKGGTKEKPVGTVFITIIGPQSDLTIQKRFGKHLGRAGIQKLSVIESLNQLRLLLLSRS